MGNEADKATPEETQATPQGEPAPAPKRFTFPRLQLPDISQVPPARIIALFVLSGVLIYLQGPPGPPSVEPSHDGGRKDLITVIESQLGAFRSNDWQTTYSFAAAPTRGDGRLG